MTTGVPTANALIVVTVEVTSNGIDYTDSEVQFEYYVEADMGYVEFPSTPSSVALRQLVRHATPRHALPRLASPRRLVPRVPLLLAAFLYAPLPPLVRA